MSMSNNDILVRIRYALDIRDIDMVEVFKLGGIEITKEDLQEMLKKVKDDEEPAIKCNDKMMESFLNGFVTFKRGKQEGQPDVVPATGESINNLLLKKLKIALSLTSEDILDILASVGVRVTKSEMSALLRKEGHKNYKECGDRYARNFLKGLALRYRG
ncbi:DUF1456 family protein [Ectobacillus ponti]|uniref:DUF1456 family protein n=1 Tax=Ectobacillus ponti TaxID=2961894 RepID=A0AA41X736_9BACI|nr:DUF1456 family protein [Ectobacillus ponti]MCP8969937.1 DUF1456 family protein [Ectobacillus ponti]